MKHFILLIILCLIQNFSIAQTKPQSVTPQIQERNIDLNSPEGSFDDAVLESPPIEDANTEKIYTFVEELPQFPGGESAMMAYLKKNLIYPKEAVKEQIEGKVFVSFVVNIDGSIEGVKVLRGVYQLLDNEALRVVKNMPKWNPGKQNGKAVRVQYTLPVNFKLTN